MWVRKTSNLESAPSHIRARLLSFHANRFFIKTNLLLPCHLSHQHTLWPSQTEHDHLFWPSTDAVYCHSLFSDPQGLWKPALSFIWIEVGASTAATKSCPLTFIRLFYHRLSDGPGEVSVTVHPGILVQPAVNEPLRVLPVPHIMRRSSVGRGFLWVFLASVLPLSASQAYDFGVDVSRLTRRAEGEAIIVGRLPAPSNGTLPLRPEIRHMRSDSYRWDLYILALSMFQYTDQVDPMSWYQVAGASVPSNLTALMLTADAGIHGVPFTSWNGVEPISGTNQSGYCTHSSVLFPMWHRPYLALYEVSLKFVCVGASS